MNTNPQPSQSTSSDAHKQSSGARRQYSETFKAELLQACAQPGANVSAMARSHGIRANQVRRWLQKAKAGSHTGRTGTPNAQPKPGFVAVALQSSAPAQADIRMSLQSGDKHLQIQWPISASSQCAQWLREVLA